MSNVNDKWSCFVLRLERESREYNDGSWYEHFWNEVYEIAEGADRTSRGERILVSGIDGDKIEVSFFDEKTSEEGVKAILSTERPKVTLRHDDERGGCNEFAWVRIDRVTLKLDRIAEDDEERLASIKKKDEMDARWNEAEKLFDSDMEAAFNIWQKLSLEGHPKSTHSVGYCYREGCGTEKDLARAIEYYELAISRGYSSYCGLSWVYNELGDTEKEMDTLERGMMMNDAPSYSRLAEKVLLGEAYSGNTKIVADLAARAFELDKAEGHVLGMCYFNGYFLPVVYPYAKYCFDHSGFDKKTLEKCHYDLPDFWDEIEPIEPSYPDFHVPQSAYRGSFNPEETYNEAMELMYGDPPQEGRARFLLKLAAESGYYKAIRSAFVNDLDGYMGYLKEGAFRYKDRECMEYLAVIYSDVPKYYVGEPSLNNAVQLWNLREKLHKHIPMEGIVQGFYKEFKKKYDEMINNKQ